MAVLYGVLCISHLQCAATRQPLCVIQLLMVSYSHLIAVCRQNLQGVCSYARQGAPLSARSIWFWSSGQNWFSGSRTMGQPHL